jgi:hypothetical protein
MIVPAMNPEETYREIIRDFQSIKRRGKETGAIFQREMIRKNLNEEKRVISFKTAQLNEWYLNFKLNRREIKQLFIYKDGTRILE